MIFGGERLNPSNLKAWCGLHGDDQPQLINMYGITETTVHVTCRRILREDAERWASPIGEPIPDLVLGILVPRTWSLAPPGVPGELS